LVYSNNISENIIKQSPSHKEKGILKNMIKKWLTIEDKFIQDLKIFDLHKVVRKSQIEARQGSFIYLKARNWVNIIPVTKTGSIVLIKQYRHGTDAITIEIPGGLVDEGEEPINAAKRECIEETGYSSFDKPELLAVVSPNPAFLTNSCYCFAWHNVEYSLEQKLDQNEEIYYFEASIDEVKDMINKGEINHTLVLNAFFYFFKKIY